MTRALDIAARMLDPQEREAVLGDLSESGEGGWRGLLQILGLVTRRQLLHWKSWRPWLAAFGLALPGSLLLMGVSLSVASICKLFLGDATQGGEPVSYTGVVQLLSRGLLLACSSWACGFAVGLMSRRTLWASITLVFFACLFCLVRFREPSISSLCLFLFLIPAIDGVRRALKGPQIRVALARLLAFAISALMILAFAGGTLWAANWFLIWPAWYIAAATQERNGQAGCG